ncbi:AraC family transcriptional regulator [Olleya sp. ITB9]|uniref:helix-turn-helix domain-containing protein n=1 Tax=Olleya sp. ITB9 TaxID=1715648 RepID=UPI0006CF81ED|nr:helix-turn-helix domain-containing protein [Olleya sp. ITB9]
MQKKVPQIVFDSKKPKNSGIEILTIESLASRKTEIIDHNPEKAHQVAFHMIVFYTQGESKQLVDFVWHPVKKNTIIHLSKGQINAFQFTKKLKGYILLFTETYLKNQINNSPKNEYLRLFNTHLFSPSIQVPQDSNIIRYFDLFYEEYNNHTEDLNQQNTYKSICYIIFSKLEGLKQFQPFHLKQSKQVNIFLDFKALLELHFKASRNADFYAEKLNITYKHLNTVCKATVSITAKQFIDQFIVLEAKRLLINSDIKSTELAYSLGFEESTNFVKYFKKHTGFTPNNFKKNYL